MADNRLFCSRNRGSQDREHGDGRPQTNGMGLLCSGHQALGGPIPEDEFCRTPSMSPIGVVAHIAAASSALARLGSSEVVASEMPCERWC